MFQQRQPNCKPDVKRVWQFFVLLLCWFRVWSRRVSILLAASCAMLLTACGGGSTNGDITDSRSAAMSSGSYGIPMSAPVSGATPGHDQWSSYFTEKASKSPFGLIGEEGAKAKSSASGFTPRTAYRFYNTANGVHFYTLSEQERNWVQANLPHFSFEGQGFFAVPTQVDELSPVYRFYNSRTGAHFYTINPSERDHVIATLSSVFTYEGVAWYGSTVPGPGWFPIYRFFNTATGTHFYTATPAERDNVRNTLPTFNYEGIGYYVRLSSSLDTALTGIDADNNGVRDSVEQVLARLIPDQLARQANVAAAAAYERVLSAPVPTTRAQALQALSDLACAEQKAGESLYESQNNGLARVIFDTDLRVNRFTEFLDVIDGGYLGSELGDCPEARVGVSRVVRKSRNIVSGRDVRVLFVNGINTSLSDAQRSSNQLSKVLEFEQQSNFNYDFFHNPNDGSVDDKSELRDQANLSADMALLIGKSFNQINQNQADKIIYYAMLGWAYKDLRLQTNSMTDSQWRITGFTLQLAARIKQMLEDGGERRLVIVPHSQGNFYVEAALGVVLDDIRRSRWTVLTEAQFNDRIRVFGIAPVSATSWNNAYISHSLDNAVHVGLPVLTTGTSHIRLPYNTAAHIPAGWYDPVSNSSNPSLYLRSLGGDSFLHGLLETYFNDEIIRSEDMSSFRRHVRDQVREQMNLPPVVVPRSRVPHTGINTDQCFRAGSSDLVACSGSSAISLSGVRKQDGMYPSVNALLYSEVEGYPITDCVRAEATGLIWEGKEILGFRAGSNSYTNLNNGTNGDASAYVRMVNELGLCGQNDWRIPSFEELHTLVDYGNSGSFDASVWSSAWFPNPGNGPYITSTPLVEGEGLYWQILGNGVSGFFPSNLSIFSIRLVRGR